MHMAQITVSPEQAVDAQTLEPIRAIDPHLVLVFGPTARFRNSQLADALALALPDSLRMGCSSSGQIDGLSVLDRSVVDLVPAGAVVDLADVFEALAASGRLAGFEAHDRFYEIGSPDGLRDLERHLSAASPGGS